MDIVLRVAVLYLVVLFTLRMTTRKTMRSSTPLDLVVIFLIGGMATTSILSAINPSRRRSSRSRPWPPCT